MEHVPWPVIPSLGGGIAEWRTTIAHGIEQSGTYFARQAWCPWPVIARIEILCIVLVEVRFDDFIGLSILNFIGEDEKGQRIFWPFAMTSREDASDSRNFAEPSEEYYLRSDKLTEQYIAFELISEDAQKSVSDETSKNNLLVYDATLDGSFDEEIFSIINDLRYSGDHIHIHAEPYVCVLSWPHYYLYLESDKTWTDHSTCTDGRQTLHLNRLLSTFPDGVHAPPMTPELRAYLMFSHILLATLYANDFSTLA